MDSEVPVAFETARLHLRPLDARDEALYCALYTDPDLMRHIAAPLSVESAQRSFLAACKQQSPKCRRWIIHDRRDDRAIGLLGLIPDQDTAEVGVMLLAGCDGHGFATESMQGIVDRIFLTNALPRLIARQSVADNPPVNRLMRKLGFRPLPPDKPWSQCNWELTGVQWQAARDGTALAPGAFRR